MMKLPVAPGDVLWPRLGKLIMRYRGQLSVVLTLQVLASVTVVALPWLTGKIIDAIQHGTGLDAIIRMIVIALVIVVLGGVVTFYAERESRVLGENVFAHLREQLVDRVTHLPLSVVEEAGTGDLLGRTTRDVERVQFMVRNGISALLTLTSTIVITVIAAVLTSPVLSLTLILPVPVMVATMRWYLPRTIPSYRAGATAWASMSGVITETMDQAETVDAARLLPRRDRKLDEAIREVWRLERYAAWQRMIMWLLLILAVFVPVGLTVAWGAYLLPLSMVTAGQISTVALYVYQIRGPMWEMTFWVDELQSAQAALARIFGVELVEADRTPSGADPEDNQFDIADVCYSYREGQEVLHGVTLDLRPGETLAMVGPSGAGKSTFGRMLAGIHPPTAGHVKVGGVDLVDLEEATLQKQVALVSQEHHVFSGTIAENLRLAKSEATDDEVRQALVDVGADEWVDQLSKGMETAVGIGGLELSPGQSQQLALARIVLLDPHTLVLDEATSLMDPTAARSLERSLGRVLEGRTVIAVAHRLHTAHDADRVAVMIDGSLVELGSHDELVAADGEYASLWASWQSE